LYRLPTRPRGALYRWDLSEDGKVAAETGGTAIVTDSLAAIDLALAGVGLAYVFEPLVRAYVAAGRLVQVLPQSAIEEPGLFLYFPRRAAMAPKLRAFIDTANEIGRASSRTPGRVA
jgi:DNA-binding transcriptional LysR family regulator